MGWVLSKRAGHSENESEPKLPPSLPNQWRHMECFGCHAGHAYLSCFNDQQQRAGHTKILMLPSRECLPKDFSVLHLILPQCSLADFSWMVGYRNLKQLCFLRRPCKNRPAPIGMKRLQLMPGCNGSAVCINEAKVSPSSGVRRICKTPSLSPGHERGGWKFDPTMAVAAVAGEKDFNHFGTST